MQSCLAPSGFRLVIPCRDCGPYIQECLASILAQDFQNWTALVADDASGDDTAQKVEPFLSDPRISYRRAPERLFLMGNTVDALNMIDPGPSEIVAILDGDDMLLPGALSEVYDKHAQGYDVVYTDIDISDGSPSIGGPLIPGVPVREQNWCITQLRSFKGYLWRELDLSLFCDDKGEPFKAAGDLSLYFPLIEAAGIYKTCFIPKKLYRYRVHENCNFKARRAEQLANNRAIRSRAPHPPQRRWFDFDISVDAPDKAGLRDLGSRIRRQIPLPYSVRVSHKPKENCGDSWDAYSGLWIGQGVFFEVEKPD